MNPALKLASSGARAFFEYFGCPAPLARIERLEDPSGRSGFFTLGRTVCFGRLSRRSPAAAVDGRLPDVRDGVVCRAGGPLFLPFDLSEVVSNLRQERYRQAGPPGMGHLADTRFARALYYFLRPALSVRMRRPIQRLRFAGWKRLAFPRWPVDDTVDALMRQVMELLLRGGAVDEMPFVWFWPNGAPGCAMMTHDVEGPAGSSFCGQLMDLDEAHGVSSSFQIVPETTSDNEGLIDSIRDRGFEVNLHDLNHDGYLFHDRRLFLERAARINEYARQLGCEGFRAGSMYRRQDWFDAFEFSFDMSVPSVAHLEPQRGGCCTVMPYFVGDILELPLTTIQDYSLFHILNDYSIDLWKQQLAEILESNGLASFITHPDYLVEQRARSVYVELLAYLGQLCDREGIWMARPSEVNRWWRSRREMRVVRQGSSWAIEGPDSDRARLAFARLEGGQVVYSLEPVAA